MTDLIGQTIGQYEIIEQIGRGGMAVVYRAQQRNVNREVAIKVLPSTLTHNSTFLERFNREVRLMARMQHARILPVYDFGEDHGRPYIVMAYMAGGTLTDRMADGPMSLQQVVHYIQQMAEGLSLLHQRGVIHRDFKPSNVLLDAQRNNAFLADFGIARFGEASIATLTGDSIIGTPAYMAPEMYEKSQLSTAVDIYALGITLYEMLTGERPFNATSPVKYMYAHLYEPVPDIRQNYPELPDSIQRVLQTALVKDPAYRYPSALDLVQAFENAVTSPEGEPYHLDLLEVPEVAAPRTAPADHEAPTMDVDQSSLPTLSPQTVSRKRSFPWWLAGVGGLLVVGAVTIIGFIVFSAVNNRAQASVPESETGASVASTDAPETTSTEIPAPIDAPTDEPTVSPQDETVPELAAVGGGSGLLGFSAAGQRYSIDVDCIVTGDSDCNANPQVLSLPDGIIQAEYGVWSPNGTLLAFTGWQGTIPSVFLTTADETEFIQVMDIPATDPAWSPDGSQLAMAAGDGDSNIWTANIDCMLAGTGDCLAQITTDPAVETDPRWTPDGAHISYLQQQSSTLFSGLLITTAGNTVQEITTTGHDSSDIFWLPDGDRWLFIDNFRTSAASAGALFYEITVQLGSFSTEESQTILTLSRGEFGSECTVGLCPGDGEFSLSPDGQYIAITIAADAREDMELYLLDLSCLEDTPSTCQNNLVQVTNNNFDDRMPVWSPDSRFLAFIRARSTSLQAGLNDDSRNAGADIFVLDVNQWFTTPKEDTIWQITSLGFVDFATTSWQHPLRP